MIPLTIGMCCYDDYEGVYFTLQALRMYQDTADCEFVIIDNYGCTFTRKFIETWTNGQARYVLYKDVQGTAAAKERVIAEARGRHVLCMDCHVMLWPDAVRRLKQWYVDHPETNDLYSGPLVYDDLKNISTHFQPEWRGQMWGTWATDDRGLDINAEPFEIPMQGMGVFSCRKEAWVGFHPEFRGFGGEEGYIHEKFRQRGHKAICLPWLRWVHRFERSKGLPYRLTIEEKFRNYLIGHSELGLDLKPIFEHFAQWLNPTVMRAISWQAIGSVPSSVAEQITVRRDVEFCP